MSGALLLRPAEAAELLGMSRSKVYELARSGGLPGAIRFGGSVRIHRGLLEAALLDQAQKGDASPDEPASLGSNRASTTTDHRPEA